MQEQQQAQMFGIPRRSCAAFTVIFFVLGFWIVTGSMSGGSQLMRYDQFLLFGDSLLQRSFDQESGFAMGAQLSNDYMRKLDVVNRGFNGYSSAQALHVLPKVIPNPRSAKIRLMVIFLGANDACLKDFHTGQHIPVDEYKQNLIDIANHRLVRAHGPRIILITPPPVDEHMMLAEERKYDSEKLGRSAAHTRKYAEACKEVGRDEGFAVLDLWNMMANMARGDTPLSSVGALSEPPNPELQKYFNDGLHFTPLGYKFLYDALTRLIADTWPDQMPEQLDDVLPDWADAEPIPPQIT